MEDVTLMRNAEEHFRSEETPAEWAISVASLPGVDAAAIVEHSPTITQRRYHFTQASRLLDAGYKVVSDFPPHALVLLPGPVDAAMAAELRALFEGVADNPHFEERRRSGGRR